MSWGNSMLVGTKRLLDSMSVGSRGFIVVIQCLFLILYLNVGCSSDDPPQDELTGSLSLLVSAPIPDDAGANVWLIAMTSDGAVDFSTSTKTKVFAQLAGTPKATAFDVIAYIPTAAGWEPAQPFASGYYATSLSRTETEEELRVGYWTSSDTLDGTPSGGILGLYEKIRVGTVSGKVTDKENNPLENAVVMVNSGLWAFTDDMGIYTISDVPEGEVKVKVSGAGIEESEQTVSVTQGAEATADQQVTCDQSWEW